MTFYVLFRVVAHILSTAAGEYSDPAVVAVLREVGLRGVEDVEPEDLLESACTIQQLYGSAVGNSSRMQQLIHKSDALLEYLHRHKSRLLSVCSGTERYMVQASGILALTLLAKR